MEVLAQKLQEHESKDSRFSELMYHLIHYYKVDLKFLKEYKDVFTNPELSDIIINYIKMEEYNLFSGNGTFKKLEIKIKKRIELAHQENWFKYFNENFIENSKYLQTLN